MLDVLTSVLDTTPTEWVGQCVLTVADAARRAGYPVRHIVAPGHAGHMGLARERAFRLSSAPWVCFVDDDDYVLPNAFACLRPHFDAGPDMICTAERQLYNNGRTAPGLRRHHLTVFRRDKVEGFDFAAHAADPDTPLRQTCGTVVDVPEVAYVWRRYLSAGFKLRKQVNAS